MQARAAIASGTGQFSIETIEVAEPIADEVLVELKASGICHTDHASLSWKRPLVMGHEGAGVVRAIGPMVRHVKPGDSVVLNWAIPCGTCFQCRRGEAVLCEHSRPACPPVRANVVCLKVLGSHATVVWHCSQLCEKANVV